MLGWLGQLGTVVTLEERLFDAATALAGSGPAFLGLVIEAFEDAGITAGLSAAKARELILSTMVGHGQRARARRASAARTCGAWSPRPAARRRPGLAQMERASVRGGIIDGVLAALARAGQLG